MKYLRNPEFGPLGFQKSSIYWFVHFIYLSTINVQFLYEIYITIAIPTHSMLEQTLNDEILGFIDIIAIQRFVTGFPNCIIKTIPAHFPKPSIILLESLFKLQHSDFYCKNTVDYNTTTIFYLNRAGENQNSKDQGDKKLWVVLQRQQILTKI